jgi:chemotaxis family two-component system sensor histidine kinase/response regulator PixL
LVIKPFSTIIAPPTCIYGCTILGDGSVIPVIDGAALLDQALERSKVSRSPALLPSQSSAKSNGSFAISSPSSPSDRVMTRAKSPTSKVLVVEDAVSLRQTLVTTLERAGYRVLQAGDGWEALRQLQFNPDIELVISDIEMPNMNGFDLMNHRRQDPALVKVPLVILTSRSSEKHRRLALHLGATAYFTKPYIEQDFLRAIRSIIEDHSVELA